MCPFYEGGTLEAQETQAQAGFCFLNKAQWEEGVRGSSLSLQDTEVSRVSGHFSSGTLAGCL